MSAGARSGPDKSGIPLTDEAGASLRIMEEETEGVIGR